jgi:hypothetical protein
VVGGAAFALLNSLVPCMPRLALLVSRQDKRLLLAGLVHKAQHPGDRHCAFFVGIAHLLLTTCLFVLCWAAQVVLRHRSHQQQVLLAPATQHVQQHS